MQVIKLQYKDDLQFNMLVSLCDSETKL